MKNYTVFAAIAVALFVVASLLTSDGEAQIQPKGVVYLQATTPGTTQTGHGNISGTMAAGQFQGGGAALTSVNADLLDGLNSTAFLQSIPVPLTLSGTSTTHIIRGENASTAFGSVGVYGRYGAGGSATYGVFGQSDSTDGRGVYGLATGTGFPIGGRFESTSGFGVYGVATATTGGTYGVYGQSNSTGGLGVYGLNTAATGTTYGVVGQSFSTDGRGVFGLAFANTGTNYGVYGLSNSPNGYGGYFDGRGYFSGNVGIGTSAPQAKLHIGGTPGVDGLMFPDGTLQTTAATGGGLTLPFSGSVSFNGSALAVTNSHANGTGVYGLASSTTGFNFGGLFETNSSDGRGVRGIANSTTGLAVGGRFASASTGGIGVWSTASATTGATYGVYGESTSTSGTGVYGSATAGSGATFGVYGHTNSTFGSGVLGYAAAGSGSSNGGYFESASTNGRGVLGSATAGSGVNFGVYGESDSTSGVGVFGRVSAISGTTYGVVGYADFRSDGFAVFADGDLGADGVKSFRIDHPDDPENKYLLHYAAESPEVINFYRGTVVLDGAGEAVVELPHYFAKINKTPSYQLTANGAPMPMLHVAAKISEAALNIGAKAGPDEAAPLCSFRIAGGAPGGEVSWRVEAVRNDRWVQNRGAPVEVQKQDLEKGTYQHPELYGQPKEKGMNYRPDVSTPRPEEKAFKGARVARK